MNTRNRSVDSQILLNGGEKGSVNGQEAGSVRKAGDLFPTTRAGVAEILPQTLDISSTTS